jgi:DNA repair exonuclease SbcCD ATPase subunit
VAWTGTALTAPPVALLLSRWRWIAWVAGALALLYLGNLAWSSLVPRTLGIPQAVEESKAELRDLRDTREQLAQSKGRAEADAARIRELAQQATAAQARAAEAEGRATRWAGEAAALRAKIGELEAERRALKPVTTVAEAHRILREMGY